jgi:ParB family chromosome partitioning protein
MSMVDDDITSPEATAGVAPVSVIIRVPVEAVTVPSDHRQVDDDAVQSLADSMRIIGLKMPISIRTNRRTVFDQEIVERILVAGRHRLAAAEKLGWAEIDAIEQPDDEQARLWQIAENLHRKELTGIERAEQIAEWVELSEKRAGQVVQKSGGVGRPAGGVSEAARSLPVLGKTEEAWRKVVGRALQISGMTDEAKSAAREAGLADNQSALLAASVQPTTEGQLKKIQEIADRKKVGRRRPRRRRSPGHDTGTPTTKQTPHPEPGGDFDGLRKAFGDAGQDIKADHILVARDTESAHAQPAEYALIRIGNSLPAERRGELKKKLRDLQDEFNLQVQYTFLPRAPA